MVRLVRRRRVILLVGLSQQSRQTASAVNTLPPAAVSAASNHVQQAPEIKQATTDRTYSHGYHHQQQKNYWLTGYVCMYCRPPAVPSGLPLTHCPYGRSRRATHATYVQYYQVCFVVRHCLHSAVPCAVGNCTTLYLKKRPTFDLL